MLTIFITIKYLLKRKNKKESRTPTVKKIKNGVIMILEVIVHEGIKIFRNRKQSIEK